MGTDADIRVTTVALLIFRSGELKMSAILRKMMSITGKKAFIKLDCKE
ncbi:MAG: hypothetical protein AB2693_33605 [Candidatus Thiodiazotropha sp.]